MILAWTGDEESGGAGIQWLLANRPELVNAEIALNEGGGPRLDDAGKVQLVELQTAEKLYQDFEVTAHGPTGHSSIPLDDNAIAQRLGCTRQQVINLRMTARKRLANREAARLGGGAGGANLAAVSSSLGDEP